MSSAAWVRIASRSRLRILFLATAFPVFFVTVRPKRGGSSSPRFNTSSRKSGPRRFSPFRTARNSARLRNLRGRPRFASRASFPAPAWSGAEALAAARAARCYDLAAAGGCHARAETVTPLTDEFGWLISTLHLFQYRGVRPFLGLSRGSRSGALSQAAPMREKTVAGRGARACAAYRNEGA